MTPADAWLIATGFTGVLLLGAVVLEQTACGRALADRLIDRILQ